MQMLDGIKAIFWDWDGTLVDSFVFLHETHNHVRKKFEMPPFSLEEFGSYFGKPREALYNEIYGGDNVEQAKTHFEAYVLDNHHKIKPMPNAQSLLETCSELGFHMGVVTNKKGELVAREVTNHGWNAHFQICIGAGEAQSDKPSPAPLLLAIQKSDIDLKPDEVLFVGDTDNDVLCAHNAGAQICFIEEDVSKHAIAYKYNARLIFSNCAEFRDFLLQSTVKAHNH